MEDVKKCLWQIKDNYADTKAKYGDLFLYFGVSNNIPEKYIDSKISYRHSYYFTNEKDAINFLYKLEDKYLIPLF